MTKVTPQVPALAGMTPMGFTPITPQETPAMKVTDEMTVKQIIALIEKLREQLDTIQSDCENVSASLCLLRETDGSKVLEAAETWADTTVSMISDTSRALKTAAEFLAA